MLNDKFCAICLNEICWNKGYYRLSVGPRYDLIFSYLPQIPWVETLGHNVMGIKNGTLGDYWV